MTTVTGTGMNGAAAATSTSPAMPLPPIPSTTTFSTRSWPGRPPMPWAADTAASTCSGRPAVAPHMSRESTGSGDGWTVAVAPAVAVTKADAPPVDAAPPASALAVRRACSASSTARRLVDQHDRDAVPHRVAAVEPGVVEQVLVGEVQERALVLGTGQHIDQERVERHGCVPSGRIGSGESGPGCSAGVRVRVHRQAPEQSGDVRLHLGHVGGAGRGVGASTLSRSRGSVLDGRRLYHQSPRSTVSPSRRSAVPSAPPAASTCCGHQLDGAGRIVDHGVDLTRVGVALEGLEQFGERLSR